MADHSHEQCPICLTNIEHLAVIPNCNHRFCYDCIIKWSKSKCNCPLCKIEFDRIIHTSDPCASPFEVEILPPPVIALVDTTLPDLECLSDTYFLAEVARLISSAERSRKDLFSNQKNRNDYGFTRLKQVINRLYTVKKMLESDTKYSPYELLMELYQMESIIQLLWSGRFDELITKFPDFTTETRRYGADDYQSLEEDEGDYDDVKSKNQSRSKNRRKRKVSKQYLDEDDYDYDFY